MKEQESIKAADVEEKIDVKDPNCYVHKGDAPYYTIQEQPVGDENVYSQIKFIELAGDHHNEQELLSEELQLLEDFLRTATQEFAKYYKGLPNQELKLQPEEYKQYINEEKQILYAIRDLNHILGRVRQKKGGYAYTRWDQYAGFNVKAQNEGRKHGLSINGVSELEYIDKKNNKFYKNDYFNKVDKSKDLQLVPMGWDEHATFMILDHTNDKIVIFDPNGDFWHLFKEQARLNKIDKDNIMTFLLGKDNAEQLKNYDLYDANGAWTKQSGIKGSRAYLQNTGKINLKPGETDGACSFVSRHWAETFLKEYFKYIKRNKTKVIKDYGDFLQDLNIKMKKNGLYHVSNLRNILKAGLENFYTCDLIKKSLFNQHQLSSSKIRNYFPQTIAKFQHLIEHYKYREHNSKVHHWEDAVQRVQQMRQDEVLERNEKKLAPTRKIMEEGFYETYGNNGLNDNQRLDGCEYLNAMKKNPIHYKQDPRTHYPEKRQLLGLKVDAYGNDLNRSEIKNNLSKKNNRNQIIKGRRGNLNLDELPGRTKMSPNLSII